MSRKGSPDYDRREPVSLDFAGGPAPCSGVFSEIWTAFVLGAGAGTAMVLRFKALGMLGVSVLLGSLVLNEVRS